jgi:primosomal protein N' (replication factor Y)
MTGFVVNKCLQLPPEFSALTSLKEIILSPDETSLITPELFKLSQWISNYYFAPLGEVLKASLPPHFQGSLSDSPPLKARLAVSLAPNYQEARQHQNLTAKQFSVLSLLERSAQPAFLSDFLTRSGACPATLKSLEKKGIVRILKERKVRDPFEGLGETSTPSRLEPTVEQRLVLEALNRFLEQQAFVPVLLHGVTGSGKTEIYLTLIATLLSQQKDSLVLMPEIGLTPRIAREFRARLGQTVAILHSALSIGERYDEWWRIRRGEARVVIGTRSAIFAPLANLKLIVVDEEHDDSYKQQESPRYNARDLALVRGKMVGALVVLGSATPAVETSYHAKNGKYRYLQLSSRVQDRPMPKVRLINMRSEFASTGRSVFSSDLETAIRSRLDRKEQVLILLNRRGYSASVLCRSCGQSIQCRNCSISLAFHRSRNSLLCHYCGYQQKVPARCPSCSSEYLYFLGEGTEKIEGLLAKMSPDARLSRLDRDTAQRKHARTRILRDFQKQEIDILVGTQMISKGHDFPNVTLVGILSADNSLAFPDFRSAERTFHLLTQMSGRAGRGDLPGEVLIQTYYPEHYCLKFVTQHDYEGFYEKEIRFRRFMHYPPFSALAMIQARDKNLEVAANAINQVVRLLKPLVNDRLRVLGPALAPLAKLKSEHRFQIILKSESRKLLNTILRECLSEAERQGINLRGVHIDVDPVSLM